MNTNVRHKIDVTNVMTGESVQRLQWSRDRRSITVYTNFGVWGVFTGADAQMINNAFIAVMNQMTNSAEEKEGVAAAGGGTPSAATTHNQEGKVSAVGAALDAGEDGVRIGQAVCRPI